MTADASVRFIHAAALPLGKVFSGLSTLDRQADLARAVGDTYDALIDLALTERVDFLILAGDTFDTMSVPYATHRRFLAGVERLDEAGIRVYMVAGNHDPLVSWDKRLDTLPGNVHMFPTDAVERVAHTRDDETIAHLYGRSYLMQSEPENFAVGYRRGGDDTFAIGVLHTSVVDADAYAPCTPEDLRVAGMDYWALGHIHKRGEMLADPPAIQCGSPQGLNVNERSAHGVYLVERSAGGAVRTTFVPLARVTWEHLPVDISGARSVEDVRSILLDAGRAAIAGAQGPVGGRAFLTGESDLHGELDPPTLEALAAEVNRVLNEPGAWLTLDSVVDRSRLAVDLDDLAVEGSFAQVVVDELDALSAAADLPDDLREQLIRQTGAIAARDQAPYEEILDRARTRIVDALSGGAL